MPSIGAQTSTSRACCARRARALWKAWTDPAHLKEWWCPKPWTTEVRAFDLRPGGAFYTFMRGPDGGTSDNPGVLPGDRAAVAHRLHPQLLDGWRPDTPWLPFTAVISLADEGEDTRYVADRHAPRRATRARHEQLGFYDGWNTCIDQLEAFARELG